MNDMNCHFNCFRTSVKQTVCIKVRAQTLVSSMNSMALYSVYYNKTKGIFKSLIYSWMLFMFNIKPKQFVILKTPTYLNAFVQVKERKKCFEDNLLNNIVCVTKVRRLWHPNL